MKKLIAYIRGWMAYTRDPVGLCPYENHENQRLWDAWWDGWDAHMKQISKNSYR